MKTCDLSKEKCEPCQGDVLPMGLEEAQELLKNLHEGWSINSLGHLERVFLVRGFLKGMDLANKFAKIAESEGHHPDFHISYGKLVVEIWTHKISGLSRSDFILAAKLDQV